MKHKRRSVASYRAASLKAARTRRRMKTIQSIERGFKLLKDNDERTRFHFDDMLPPEPTINKIPKVEW